jgi:hypothetical protein
MNRNIFEKLLGSSVILVSIYTFCRFIFTFEINRLAIAAILFCTGVSVMIFSANNGAYRTLSSNFLKAGFYISLVLIMKWVIFG